ncbi:MAG: transposase [Hyphomicrobiales bacterium]|nr:transposase [Hyphomicrobiales bacterium]
MNVPDQPHFKQPDKARKLLEAVRWPHGVVCPRCGSMNAHYTLRGASTRAGLWKCRDCREQFSVTVGTVFEHSKISLHLWLRAIYLLCSSRKRTSIFQLAQELDVTYKTAWYMSARIRDAIRHSRLDSPGGFGSKGKIADTGRKPFAGMTHRRRAGPAED